MGTLELEFSGLCGFVPKYSLDTNVGTTANRVRVLLVDAMGHRGDPGDEHHEPVLVLPKNGVIRSGCYRRGWCATTAKKEEVVCFTLARQDLFIGDPDDAALEIAAGAIDKACPTEEKENHESLRWLATMPKIYSSAGVAKHAFLGDDFLGETPPPHLAARVLLTSGCLKNGTFSGYDQPSKWGFESEPLGSGSARIHRALSESVTYTFKLSDEQEGEAADLILTTRHFVTKGEEKIGVTFKDSDKIEGRVVNMPWVDILKRRDETPAVDRHFTHFYDLAERDIRKDHRRLPHREPSCPAIGLDPRLVGHPKCPPALFAEDSSV